MSALDWTLKAACRLEVDWTPENRPEWPVEARMYAVCRGCPVKPQCAVHALASGAESGMYAGVWLPNRKTGSRTSVRWREARDRLRDVVREAS